MPKDSSSIEISLPTLFAPTSQLCTAAQFDEPGFARIADILGGVTGFRHRKTWEWIYIFRAIELRGMLLPGKAGVGFGCGKEPLASSFASFGVNITGTDAPSSVEGNQGWSTTEQHSSKLEDLWSPELIDREGFDKRVSFEAADMRNLPKHLKDFDFVWSSCALEHLGSIDAGLDFISNSLDCIRPGGVAVHTTEFNLDSNDETLELDWLSVYRRCDIERIAARLEHDGHTVSTINFFPGHSSLDAHVDLPPFAGLKPHLKLHYLGHTFTSIGLIVTKALE